MGKIEFQQIIRWLPKLTDVEKRMLMKQLGGTTPPAIKEGSIDDWLLPGISAELRRRGLSHPSLTREDINRIAPNYWADSLRVRADLRTRLSAKLKHGELIGLGHIVVRALADYRSPVTPIGVKFLLTNIGKIPEAIEQSFPGYLACGMLHHLIRTKI